MTPDRTDERPGRGGVIAATGMLTVDQLDEVAAAAPWRGQLTWQESGAGSTIAVTGRADIGEAGRWIAAVDGTITNRWDVADHLGVHHDRPGDLAAAALARPGRGAAVLRGAFRAIALDRSTGEIRAFRSVGGGRGMAWSRGPDRTAVATEPEQAAQAACGQHRPDHAALHRYRSGRLRRADTFIQGADWLLPGSCLSAGTVDDDRVRVALVDLAVPPPGPSSRADVEEVEEAIDGAVERAIAGGRSIAALATGGLDSSSLIGFAARHTTIDLAVTSRVQTLDGSSAEASLAASSMVGLANRHEIIDLTVSDLFDGMVPLLPVTGPPGVLVMGLMAAGYRTVADADAEVLLDGIGGDQLFSFNPILIALAERDLGRLAEQARRSPRGLVRLAPRAALLSLSRRQRHRVMLGDRIREWNLHADASIRDRLAAHLGLRLEVPYLDEDLWRTVAATRLDRHGPGRRLQRAAVAGVLPHVDRALKVTYGDAQQRYFGAEADQANRLASEFFVERWLAQGA